MSCDPKPVRLLNPDLCAALFAPAFLLPAAQMVRAPGLVRFVNHDARPVPPRAERVGRNSPCPCGSGKKFKKCCQ